MARKSSPKRSPVANENASALQRTLAPWPQIDRWPIILGSNLTIAYLASVYRICQQGYRQQFVDALNELLEKDPHAQAVYAQRALAVAGGRVELIPAHVADPTSKEAKRAVEIRDDLQRRVDAIPLRKQALFSLVFSAIYYGVGGLEINWNVTTSGWHVTGLGFIHSRRISYPDQCRFEPHIWDQGSVSPGSLGFYPTEGFFGLRVEDYPGKFILHTPQFRADYPLREGLGRVTGWFSAIKLMAVRGGGDFVERFSKPWAIAYYSTIEEGQTAPRAATKGDIDVADAALSAIGAGSLSSATLPDSIKVVLDGPGIKGATGTINHEKLIDLCDAQTSKAVRGGTLQTDAGEKGARSLGEVHAEGDVRNARYDAACLADRLKESLVSPLCHLNYPGEESLCPGVTVHVEEISPEQILERATKFAAMGGKPDGRWLAGVLGITMADAKNPEAVPLAPLKPVDLFALAASATDLPSAVAAMAALVGMQLTPANKTALAEMEHDDVARLLQSLLGAAKADEKVADGEPEGAETEPMKTAPPTRTKTRKPGKGAKTTTPTPKA